MMEGGITGEQFLDHEVIGQAIIDLVQGERPRCAVAFWGAGAAAQLFGPNGPGQARILCELSMNATNPAELEELGAPSNPLIKHLERLHAKVYISQVGAIVCSANASENGLGFGDAAGLVEAGVFLAPDTDAFQRAEQWFKDAWDDANAVDERVLASAWEAWNRKPRGGRPTCAPPVAIAGPSLLGTVIADPARFRGVGFVFTTGRAAKADRDEAAEELTQLDHARDVPLLSDDDYDALRKWPIGDLFTGWAERDLDAWPRKFICIYMPGNAPSYWYYKRVHTVWLREERGVVFAERPPKLKSALSLQRGDAAMLRSDAPLPPHLCASRETRPLALRKC